MSDSCSGLLTTGAGTNEQVRDPKKCEKICADLSVKFTANSTECAVPLPADKPELVPQKASTQAGAQKSAAGKASEAEKAALTKQKISREAGEYGKSLQSDKIGTSEELLRRWERELNSGKSRSFPPDRSKWKQDKYLVEEAKRAREENKAFPAEKANRAFLPAIRGELHQFSRARALESNSTKDLGAIALTLAQLGQIKTSGEANAEGLDQSSARAPLLVSASMTEQKKRQGLVGSNLKVEPESSSEETQEIAGDSPGSNELAPAEAQAKAPASDRESLRAKLRELLRKKLAAEGLSEMPEEFLGELGIPLASTPGEAGTSDQAAAQAAEEEIFRLAGADTDKEIQRLKGQLQEEIARAEGVLSAESLSLFERVKAAHVSCAARQCVGFDQRIARPGPMKKFLIPAASFYRLGS